MRVRFPKRRESPRPLPQSRKRIPRSQHQKVSFQNFYPLPYQILKALRFLFIIFKNLQYKSEALSWKRNKEKRQSFHVRTPFCSSREQREFFFQAKKSAITLTPADRDVQQKLERNSENSSSSAKNNQTYLTSLSAHLILTTVIIRTVMIKKKEKNNVSMNNFLRGFIIASWLCWSRQLITLDLNVTKDRFKHQSAFSGFRTFRFPSPSNLTKRCLIGNHSSSYKVLTLGVSLLEKRRDRINPAQLDKTERSRRNPIVKKEIPIASPLIG